MGSAPGIAQASIVSAKTIGDAWLGSISAILNHGVWYHDATVPLLELMGMAVRITSPLQQDPLIDRVADSSVMSRMHQKFARADRPKDWPFSYGERLYAMNGTDQVSWLVNRIREKPETKSATISLLIAGDDSRHLPCFTTLDAKLRFGMLHLQFFFRSQNVVGRQYANLCALAALQNELATQLGVNVGTLQGHIASAHIYGFDLTTARALAEGKRDRLADRYYYEGPDTQ